MPDRRQPKNVYAQVGKYTGLAFILPVSTLVGWAIGYFLDKLFHTHFLYLVFLILGVIAGFMELLRELEADTQQDGK